VSWVYSSSLVRRRSRAADERSWVTLLQGDPDRVRELAIELSSASDRTREAWDQLISIWLMEVRPSWDDAQGAQTHEELTETNYRLRRVLDELELLARRFQAHAGRLDEYLASSGVSGSDSRPPAPGARSACAAAPPKWGSIGETVVSREGKRLELWSFSGVTPQAFDWGAPSFPAEFEAQSHHGNTAEDYRRWAREAGDVVKQVRAGGWDSVDGANRQVRDVFLGSEPVRVIIPKDGSMPVVESRHRVLAAIQTRATIPVEVVRLGRDSACDRCGGRGTCLACGGSGRTVRRDRSSSIERAMGFENRQEVVCPSCNGTGRCPSCAPVNSPPEP
jgi:hypothetical protein